MLKVMVTKPFPKCSIDLGQVIHSIMEPKSPAQKNLLSFLTGIRIIEMYCYVCLLRKLILCHGCVITVKPRHELLTMWKYLLSERKAQPSINGLFS